MAAFGFVKKVFIDGSSTVPIDASNLNALEDICDALVTERNNAGGVGIILHGKILNGTTSNTQGGTVSIAHGLSSDKILSCCGVVYVTSDSGITSGYNPGDGYYFSVTFGPTYLVIVNKNGDSANILSKPIKIYIVFCE
jgi:hypothetical protein